MPARSLFDGGRFPTTHWSLVARAGQDAAESRREALEELLHCYLPALHAHLVYGRRIAPDDADDLLQEFVAGRMMEKDLLGRADRELGKFRTYLLAVLDRFLIDQVRRRKTRKHALGRGWGGDQADAVQAIADRSSADAFDVAWARQSLTVALRRMQDECNATGRPDVWGVFEARLLDPLLKGTTPIDNEELAARYGMQSAAQASNVLVTAKRMFARLIRAEIGRYALGEEAVESEIRDLHTILAKR